MREIKHIVVHCTATGKTATIKSLLAGWRAKGWRKPGYHYVVPTDGRCVQLTPENEIANGVRGHNATSIHISYIGGIDPKTGKAKDTRTDLQRRTLLIQLKDLKRRYPNAEIVGHRDLSPDMDGDGVVEPFEWVKECPSFDARNEYSGL